MKIGFSTGALTLGDFRAGLELLRQRPIRAVELSALRVHELPSLIEALPSLDLTQFSYVAVHAPSHFSADEEISIVGQLRNLPSSFPIVLHPDTIHDCSKWHGFGPQLLIENMDRRKADGRTAKELLAWFDRLPSARLCFDLAHAQHFDPTMTEAFSILTQFTERIGQVHISELDSASRHFPLSYSAIQAFSEVTWKIPKDAVFIIESRIQPSDIEAEFQKVRSLISQLELIPA
jgi:Xylose isomerase-like TIM barrel